MCATTTKSISHLHLRRDSFLPQNVVDKHEECETWGAEGECITNPLSMLTWCAETCTRVAESTAESHSREL